MSPSRSQAERIARETVATMDAGRYTAPTGTVVEIGDALAAAVAGTVAYPPGAALPRYRPTGVPTAYEVRNETTLSAAGRLHAAGLRAAALNFASAHRPGGGFLGGARAQEEFLCRSSGLYACLVGGPMYAHHAGLTGGFYTNYAVYSPAVPVFRDDAGELLPEPYPCGFITLPAVNAGVYLGRGDAGAADRVGAEMRERVAKVLAVAAGHGHDGLVLGAWGCGVFRNDPDRIAGLFRDALDGPFAGVFARVAFAVLDTTPGRSTIRPFEGRFGPAT